MVNTQIVPTRGLLLSYFTKPLTCCKSGVTENLAELLQQKAQLPQR